MGIFQKLEANYLIAPKLIYLIVNLQFYGFHQLKFAFARDKFSISDDQYGKFTGYIQFMTFFTNILVGRVSDKTRKYKPTLMFLIVISMIVFVYFYITPLMNLHPMMFWAVLFLYLVFNNPKQPLLDKIMIEHLEEFSSCGSKVYGRQRLWGTLSLSLATYICEWCTSRGDGTFDFNYLIHYNVLATILAVLVVVFLVKRSNALPFSSKSVEPQSSTPVGSEPVQTPAEKTGDVGTREQTVPQPSRNSKPDAFIELIKNKEFLFFIMIIFSNAVTRSALTIYLSIFHKEILQIKPYELPSRWPAFMKTTLGMFNNKPIATLATFGIVFEMVIMFLSEGILNRLGFFGPLILAQTVSLARFMAYYLISPQNTHVYGLSCLFELLRGIYFGLIHISSVHIAPRLAPPHLKATSQMIYQGTFSALGSLVSGYIFGDMFESKIKGNSLEAREAVYKQIFLINSLITFVTILVCFIKYGLKDRVLFSREAEEAKLSSYSRGQQTQ